jgi:hypothetical protein
MRAVREEPIDPVWVERTLDSLEQIVRTGDESHLAETVVSIVNSPGAETVRIP